MHKIVGKEVINGVLHYRVRWAETPESEHSPGDAKEIVDRFETRLSAKREVKKGKKGPGLNRGKDVLVEANASAGQQQKRWRGRSLKNP